MAGRMLTIEELEAIGYEAIEEAFDNSDTEIGRYDQCVKRVGDKLFLEFVMDGWFKLGGELLYMTAPGQVEIKLEAIKVKLDS